MIEFTRHSNCELCPLHESAHNPGLPTRPLYDGQPIRKDRAILFVGQSPGHHEDKKSKSFVGYTGQLIGRMIAASRLADYCDIYLANSCRCKPPQGADESQSNIRICRAYIQEDVAKLQAQYKEVIIFALGAKACYSTLNISSLNESLKKQAKLSQFFDNVRVFCTYHPAMLHPTRKPGLVKAVEAHFMLLVRYLKDEFIPHELKIEPEVLADVPEKSPAEVSVDLETYGILAGCEQTVFHPVKSKEVDGVEYKYQIVTVSFAWKDGDRIRTALYMFNFKAHRAKIREWFRRICKDKITCIGQNLKFDLLYLSMCGDQELPYWIDPRRLKVDDTLLMSFLLYEQQPEKGLKELSTLFGIADYSGVRISGKSGTAKSCRDKDLHYYNCLDSAATLVLYDELKRRIAGRYGSDTPKLSDTCAWVRNMAIWDTFDLEANGSTLDVLKLKKYHDSEQARCEELMKESEEKYGLKLAGKGSDAPLRQLMLDCLAEANLMEDSRVEWSKKTGKISIGVENVNIIKSSLSPNADHYLQISAFQEYKEHSKIVTTYTGPLLTDRRRGIVKSSGRIGHTLPSWYPVPAYAERGGSSDDKAGGQIQGRFSCKRPARQTEPPSIRKCSCSRWPNGKLVEYDVNADHLRMAALLSGDPILMDAYTSEGKSLHAMTACTIFPDENPEDIKNKSPERYKLGKTLNFLVLFRGGAEAFQRTALEDVGVELDIEFCQQAIHKWYAKHRVYKEWQDSMIDLAARQGYLVLPTGWSRTFGLGHQNIAGQQGEVCNFLHQAPCAQITQSAHYAIKLKFLKYRLRSAICLNIYDALFVDMHQGEEQAAHEIVVEAMTNPPLLPVFERRVGRTIPWAFERKEYE